MSDAFRHPTEQPDPHRATRARLLAAHPELAALNGRQPWTAVWIVSLVVLQLALSVPLSRAPTWALLLVAVTVGAFASHGLFVLIHECAHRLVFASRTANTALAIVADLAHGIPSAVSFSRYHLAHHRRQGDYAHDADLPMTWEHDVFGTTPLGKLAWLCCYPFLMIARSARVSRMTGMPAVDPATIVNTVCVLALDGVWAWQFGWRAVLYLLVSFYFGIGPHVLGARWLQEHYVFHGEQETNSYYGPLNAIAFHVGLHNEHNDFPNVPWSRLPAVTRAAPEHYGALWTVRSYPGLILRFLFDGTVTLRSRVVR